MQFSVGSHCQRSLQEGELGHRTSGIEEAAATTSWGWDGMTAPPHGEHCIRIISVNFQDLLSFVFLSPFYKYRLRVGTKIDQLARYKGRIQT